MGRSGKKPSSDARLSEAVLAGAIGAAAGMFFARVGLQSLISFWGDDAVIVVLSGIAFTALGAALGPANGRRAAVLALLAAQALYAAVAFTPMARLLEAGIIRDDGALRKADAVFVFGSALHRNGDLSDVASNRLLHGLEILGRDWAPRLILSELPHPHHTYVEAAQTLMRRIGMRQEVLGVGPVRRSRDEAVLVAALFKKQGWKTIIAVTSPLHSRRACATLESEGLEVICSPSSETRYEVPGLPHTEDRLRAFSSAIHEQVGLWYYRWRGWISG